MNEHTRFEQVNMPNTFSNVCYLQLQIQQYHLDQIDTNDKKSINM